MRPPFASDAARIVLVDASGRTEKTARFLTAFAGLGYMGECTTFGDRDGPRLTQIFADLADARSRAQVAVILNGSAGRHVPDIALEVEAARFLTSHPAARLDFIQVGAERPGRPVLPGVAESIGAMPDVRHAPRYIEVPDMRAVPKARWR